VCVLAKFGVDDPLLDRRVGLPEALVQDFIRFGESPLEEIRLLVDFLLGDGLCGDEFLELRQ